MMRAFYVLLLAGLTVSVLAGCGASSAVLDQATPTIISTAPTETASQQDCANYNYSLQSGVTGEWHWPWDWAAPTASNSVLGGRGSVIVGETGVPIGGVGGGQQGGG
jgi:hypothetical protein